MLLTHQESHSDPAENQKKKNHEIKIVYQRAP